MISQRVTIAIPVLMLLGCSTHPLPEDVTRKTTFEIVERIRCEAREGIMRETLSAAGLKNIYIGMDFSFDMEEKNDAKNGSLEFSDPFGRGSFSLTLNGGVEKARQTERFFRVVESFQELKDYKLCSADGAQPNLIYPTSGRVGVDEVVHTFIKLERLTRLSVQKKRDDAIFSDTLTFTTDLSAGANPNLIINSGVGGFRLRNASIETEVRRKDIHKITIAISQAPAAGTVPDVLLNGRILRAAPLVGLANPAAPVIYELERLRNRDDDAQIIERLRPLP